MLFPTFLVKQPFFSICADHRRQRADVRTTAFFCLYSKHKTSRPSIVHQLGLRNPCSLSSSIASFASVIANKHYMKTVYTYFFLIYVYTHIVINIKLSEMTAHCTHVMVVNTGRYSWRRRVDFQQRRLQIRRNLNKRFRDWKSKLPYTNFLFYRPSFFGSASWFWAQARSRLGSGYSFMLNGLYL